MTDEQAEKILREMAEEARRIRRERGKDRMADLFDRGMNDEIKKVRQALRRVDPENVSERMADAFGDPRSIQEECGQLYISGMEPEAWADLMLED